MKLLLKAVELPYRGVNRLRRALYRAGVLRGKRLNAPVISIGNIAAGGTGKTPAVIAVCNYLSQHGLRVAVLTRGYGRGDAATTGAVTSLDAAKYGDEPVLIKSSTSADVYVGSHRYDNAKRLNYDVFLLDDGFQHLQLERDLDVVIDAPASFYREGRAALRDADIVIPRRIALSIPESLRGRRLFAFAGLANNEQFFSSLREAGLDLTGTRGFPDHHRYTPADLASLRLEAKGAALVTTEKDLVKLDARDVTAVRAAFIIDEAVLKRVLDVAQGAS